VRYSGWPFSKSELEPYYERSHAILRLGPKTFETDFWVDAIGRRDVKRLPLTSGRVVDGISQFSPPVRFGRDYLDELQRAPHITIYLYANAGDIDTDDGVCELRSVSIATLTGRRVRASAKVFVLATGGIENARLMLLSSRERRPDGLGNHNGLVGRFFMDHPRVYGARVERNANGRGTGFMITSTTITAQQWRLVGPVSRRRSRCHLAFSNARAF
jgi:hypothetical protein